MFDGTSSGRNKLELSCYMNPTFISQNWLGWAHLMAKTWPNLCHQAPTEKAPHVTKCILNCRSVLPRIFSIFAYFHLAQIDNTHSEILSLSIHSQIIFFKYTIGRGTTIQIE